MEQFYTIITPLLVSQVVYEWEKGRAYTAEVLGENRPNTWEYLFVVVFVKISWKAKDSDEVCF